MFFYYAETNQNGVNLTPSNNPSDKSPAVLYDEKLLQVRGQSIIQNASNMGSVNPFKGPNPRSLFYDASFRNPGKYGQFLIYSIGKNENDFIDAYYRSENSSYNQKISSIPSKNPSASALVRESMDISLAAQESSGEKVSNLKQSGNIIGGISAPYSWKDFLYCKYYGTVPNNYMITLRRYQTPMRDNLSLPDSLSVASVLNEGVGRPVAQAVTWWGGDTGNRLNDVISFSSGLNWTLQQASAAPLVQQGWDRGFFNSPLYGYSKELLDKFGIDMEKSSDYEQLISTLAALSDPNSTAERQKLAYSLRDVAESTPNGPLADYIWTSVDTVDTTYTRGRGINFVGGELDLKFTYDLTSVGEVNTKAAMLDLLASLLGMGTNYGQFITPDIRYNNSFPAIGYPGGDKGINESLLDPIKHYQNFGNRLAELFNLIGSGSTNETGNPETIGGNQAPNPGTEGSVQTDGFTKALKKLASIEGTKALIESVQVPLSFLTGAPVGEWHMVVGNPMNPIAMIGNLICDNVSISFSEKLGPDDFPCEMTATFSLKHGRSRDRGEIESMFNRGDGRLYETALPTYSSGNSTDSFVTTNGDRVDQKLADNIAAGNIANPASSNNFNFGE
jgi:hypothetical protein